MRRCLCRVGQLTLLGALPPTAERVERVPAIGYWSFRALFSEALVYWASANNRVEDVLGHDSAAQLRGMADHVASEAFLADYNSRSVQA